MKVDWIKGSPTKDGYYWLTTKWSVEAGGVSSGRVFVVGSEVELSDRDVVAYAKMEMPEYPTEVFNGTTDGR